MKWETWQNGSLGDIDCIAGNSRPLRCLADYIWLRRELIMPVHSSGDERTTDVENCYFSVQWTISYIRSVAILNIEVTQNNTTANFILANRQYHLKCKLKQV